MKLLDLVNVPDEKSNTCLQEISSLTQEQLEYFLSIVKNFKGSSTGASANGVSSPDTNSRDVTT